MPAPLLAVDAPSLLYRAFFALPDSIKGAEGRPVNALLGACNLLLSVVDAQAPRAVVVCFGAEAAAYRVAAFPGYHADRPPMPEALVWQWEQAPGLFEAFGWEVHGHDELEADDLIHSFALDEAQRGGRGLILTGDRDLFQSARDAVTVLYLQTGGKGPLAFGPAQVRERYGVTPEQVPDLIALRGDPSDGIPGARGIGEKTAAKLLAQYGTLEGVLAAAGEQTPRIAATLRDSAAQLQTFLEMATAQRIELPVPADGRTDLAAGAAAAQALGMAKLAERLSQG